MKNLFLLTFLSFISLVIFSQQGGQQISGDGDLKWSLPNVGPGTMTDNPQYVTLGPDGTVYVTTEQAYLVALQPEDGEEKWNLADHPFPPSIAGDGTIFSGSGTDLVAINTDGSEQWRIPAGVEITTSPAQAADGTVYAGANPYLIAFDPGSQQEKWRLEVGENFGHAPTIGYDATVYIASGHDLVAVNPSTHIEMWRFTADDPITTSAVHGTHGIIYIGANSKLYALNPDGTEKWNFKPNAYIGAAPAIGTDGTLYLPVSFLASGYCGYGSLLAIHPDGYQKWRLRTNYYNRATPSLGADGTIYLPTAGVEGLMAVDIYGNEKWRYPAFGNANWSAPVAPDGTIYFAATLGTFSAIETSSGGLADSPWPMDGHDAQHTGRNDEFVPSCPGPVITVEPQNQLIEAGNSSTLNVTAEGMQPLNYQWYEGHAGDISNPAGTGSSFITPALTESKQYWVKITNACGFTYSRTVTVAVGIEGETRWYFEASEEVLTSAAMADDGTIYFGTEDAILYAVNPDGTEQWQFQLHYEPENLIGYPDQFVISSDPTVAPDGTVYILSNTWYDTDSASNLKVGQLWAINQDGSEKWTHKTEETNEPQTSVYSSPALGVDGSLYFTDRNARLYAVNGDGSRKWLFEPSNTEAVCWSSPTIGMDGVIYYSSRWFDAVNYTYYQIVYAVKPDGTEYWNFPTDNADGFYANPVVGADGKLYLPGPDEYFLALKPDGSEEWRFYTGALCSNAVIGADGTIYFGAGGDLGYLYAISPEGDQLWKSAALFGETLYHTSPVIGADGLIYVRMGSRLYAMDPADGSEKWNIASIGEGTYSSPLISQDGTLYLGRGTGSAVTNVGYLWAITTSSLGLADSHWPVAGQNNYHWQRDPDADVNCEAPVIIVQPQDQTISSGNQATLEVAATGTALSYEWFEGESGDQSTPVDTGAVMTTKALNQDTDYWVMVSNACGEEYSQTATVTVVAGIHEGEEELAFYVFPNPCRDKIQITSSKLQTNSQLPTPYSLLPTPNLKYSIFQEEQLVNTRIRE